MLTELQVICILCGGNKLETFEKSKTYVMCKECKEMHIVNNETYFKVYQQEIGQILRRKIYIEKKW